MLSGNRHHILDHNSLLKQLALVYFTSEVAPRAVRESRRKITNHQGTNDD
jgi:hypothetical protein